MEIVEIVIVIIGIGLYLITFLIPDKKNSNVKYDMSSIEETIKERVELEYEEFRIKVEDVLDDTISYASEKTERILERLTNEKIQHIDEFSSTVLKEIHKNHEETMFLYDMLVQKHKAIKNINPSSYRTEELDAVASNVKNEESCQVVEVTEENEEVVADGYMRDEQKRTKQSLEANKHVDRADSYEESRQIIDASVPTKKLLGSFMALEGDKKEDEILVDNDEILSDEKELISEPLEKSVKIQSPEEAKMDSIMEEVKTAKVENYNLKILELYKEGLDEKEIAKVLGRGVGEVKLVVGLFKEE